ncbi:flagellar assembly peptidoglycan hydrolase FlgJ [Leeia sp. TBRC 13508]|uniref:Peptidoglycan hydrolase FlgJ n=1 Tax=Leeia speluncae TaxID=2884804 RepID=A0ABS8D9B7_9NEIS|nr:flagellar assembly peptidoglycan hydrolase FlgJ [Leeia speluncae]MCB6184774.1 flagellar assembly peptidoglycan hydrolase FlgJ [Leeia speluncae]
MNPALTGSSTINSAPSLAIDVNAIGNMKAGAAKGDVATLRKAAQQFEALLLEQMMKSMRATVGEDEIWDSSSTKMFQGMYDQQISLDMANSKGIGLADMLVRQLLPQNQQVAATDAFTGLNVRSYNGQARQPAVTGMVNSISEASTQLAGTVNPINEALAAAKTTVSDNFIDRISGGLQTAASMLGVSQRIIAAHAALESGWGKKEIKDSNGKTSFNLFGIKANSDWQGKSVETLTTEYINGSPVKKVERFRAYSSYEEAFADYANLLAKNDRYRHALNKGNDATGFGLALQNGGYATDPTYAMKLAKVARQTRLQNL